MSSDAMDVGDKPQESASDHDALASPVSQTGSTASHGHAEPSSKGLPPPPVEVVSDAEIDLGDILESASNPEIVLPGDPELVSASEDIHSLAPPLPPAAAAEDEVQDPEGTQVLDDFSALIVDGGADSVEPDDAIEIIDDLDELELEAVDAEIEDAEPVAGPPKAPPPRPPPPPRMPPPMPRAAPSPPVARMPSSPPVARMPSSAPVARMPSSPPVAVDALASAASALDSSGDSSPTLGLGPASGPVANPAVVLSEPEPELEPARPTVLETHARSLDQAAWQARAEHLQARLETSADPDFIAVAAHELGELYERRLGDPDRAQAAYHQSLQTDPSLRANLWSIRRLLVREGRFAELLGIIDAEIDYAQSDEERADLYVEKGHVLEDRLDQSDDARVAYEYALDLMAPDTPSRALIPALMGLERIALATGDQSVLERIWARLVEAVTEPEHKLSYLLDMAAMQAERGDVEQALGTISDAAALGVDRDRVARQTLRIAEAAGDADTVLSALELRIEHLSEQFGPAGAPDADALSEPAELTARERSLRLSVAALRRRQARVVLDRLAEQHIDQPEHRQPFLERAWQYLHKALALAPGEALVLTDLADVAEALGRHEELAELCQQWQGMESDAARALGLSLRRAEALFGAGKREEAHALLDALSASAPGYLPLTTLRERDALAAQDWGRLALAYADAATAARLGTAFTAGGPGAGEAAQDPGWAAALYASAGDLFVRELGDLDRARDLFGKALEAQPGYGPAIEALCELYAQAGVPDQAAQLLESCLASGADPGQAGPDQAATPERQIYLLQRLCRFYEDLGDWEQTLGAQKRLLAVLGPDSPESARLLWRIESTLAALDRPDEQVALLVDLANRGVDPIRRGQAFYKAARLCEARLDNPAQAADLYRQVLDVWPGDRYARVALVNLLGRAGRWDDLVAERKSEAAELADGPSLVRALREAAMVLHRELGKKRQAAEVYRALLDRAPAHPGVLRSLAELLDSMVVGRSSDARVLGELIDVLEQESVLDGDSTGAGMDAARAIATLRLAMTHERAGRPDEAMDAYRRAADEAPDSALALVALAELAAAGRDEFSYIDALSQLAQARPDARIKSELVEEVGWLWASAADDLDRAIEAFDEAIELDAARPGPYLGKLLLQARQGDVAGSGETLVSLAQVVESPAATAAMMLRAAIVAEAEGQVEAVNDRLFAALNHAPDDQDTLMLAAEYARVSSPEEAVGPEQLLGRAELFAMRASLANDPRSRMDWELTRAEALEGAGRLRDAATLVQAILAEKPGNIRALQLLRRISARGNDRAGLARASLALARQLSHAENKCVLLREAAAIYDAELGDPATAAAVYRHLLDQEPAAAEFDRLAAIYREHDDVTSLFEILGARIHWLDGYAAEHGDEARVHQVPLLYERATLRGRLGDTRGAIRDRAMVLAIDPNHGPALWDQAQAMNEAGESESAAGLLGRYLEAETVPQKRAEAELVLSRILAEDMDDVGGAIAQLERVIEQSPGDLDVRERFIKLLGRKGDWARMIDEIRALSGHRTTPAERARDELRVAEIFRDKVGDAAAAKSALNQARDLDPLDIDVVRQLAEILASNPKERAQVLARAAGDLTRAIARSPAEARLYERLAAVHGWLDAPDARYYALCGVSALGSLAADKKQAVARQAAALASVSMPSTALSEGDWQKSLATVAGADTKGVGEVWNAIAEAVTRCQGLDPGKFGFARGDKMSSRNLSKRFAPLAAVVESFGLSTAEYYVSDSKPGFARVLSMGKPVLCLGADVAGADSPTNRFLLGRAVAMARQGTGSLLELGAAEVANFLAAAARVAGISPLPPTLTAVAEARGDAVEECSRELQKHLGWRDKRALVQVFERNLDLGDPEAWWRAALCVGARAGLLIAGDAGAALEVLDAGGNARSRDAGDSRGRDPIILDLVAWMVSPGHLGVRHKLGMGTK